MLLTGEGGEGDVQKGMFKHLILGEYGGMEI